MLYCRSCHNNSCCPLTAHLLPCRLKKPEPMIWQTDQLWRNKTKKKRTMFSLGHFMKDAKQTEVYWRPTLDNDASPITSVPSIRAAPLFARLTVKAAGSFPTRTSHQFNTALVHKVPGLFAKSIKCLVSFAFTNPTAIWMCIKSFLTQIN